MMHFVPLQQGYKGMQGMEGLIKNMGIPMQRQMMRMLKRNAYVALVLWGSALLLTGCGTRQASSLQHFAPEAFSQGANFSHYVEASPARACEAARRTLLSQGYVISVATPDQVTGRKFYQPDAETHVPLEMRIVCASEAGDAAMVFAAAVQEHHALRKTNSSASLGVGALGSLSLPVQGSNDGMVKVGTQTITDPSFYRSFFALLSNHLEP